MATPTAIAKRTSDAQKRMAEAGPRLAARLGIDYPAVVKSKDPNMQRAREMEAFAGFLESVEANTPEAVDVAALKEQHFTEFKESLPDPVDLAALKEQHFAEFVEAFNADAPAIEAIEMEFDPETAYGAIYDAYAADERRGSDDDRQAFMEALQQGYTLEVPLLEVEQSGERTAPEEAEPDATDADVTADADKEPDPDAAPPAADPSNDDDAKDEAQSEPEPEKPKAKGNRSRGTKR